MPNSLDLQSASAAQYIRQFWPLARERASRVLSSEFRQIILCGCGDSHHAAYALSYAITNWTDHAAQGLHSMEAARYAIPRSAGNDLLVIGISASGETARTIEAMRLAKDRGAHTLGITADPESTLATTANSIFELDLPDQPEGPGLISYLAALLAGYAIGYQLAKSRLREPVDSALNSLPEALSEWMENELAIGQEAAQNIDPNQPIMFLGSGPVRGAAMFAAAKVVEAAGQSASSQDVEEWAHLEYFNDPSQLPVWLLSAGGRSLGREQEVAEAAIQIGRTLIRSEWSVGPDWLREDLSPLVLWAGPVKYANSLMDRLGERPFRDFTGGRDRSEGGGASRIRSSAQLHSLKELSKIKPFN